MPCTTNAWCEQDCSCCGGLPRFCAPEKVYGQTGNGDGQADERATRIAGKGAEGHEPLRGDEQQSGTGMAGNAVVDCSGGSGGRGRVAQQEKAETGQAKEDRINGHNVVDDLRIRSGESGKDGPDTLQGDGDDRDARAG